MPGSRRLLAGIVIAFALVMSLSYVVPNAQALESESPESPMPVAQSFTAPAAALAATSRDAYGVTVRPILQWPLPADTRMASDFGGRSCAGCSSNHEGIDLNAAGGTPIEAMAAGVVVETNPNGSGAFGEHVRIEHLIDGQVVTSLYAHMQAGSKTVAEGDLIAVGQVLGLEGCTGSCTGNHLHFEIHPGGGAPVDPAAWLHARLG